MAMTQSPCDSYLLELHQAIHAWGTDVFKLALYSSSASLSYATTAYSATNEITGTGYSAGGFTLALASTYPKISNRKWLGDFDNLSANPAVFSTRYGLIYNSSKSNRAMFVLDFGQLIVAANSFSFVWPTPTDYSAAIMMGYAQ